MFPIKNYIELEFLKNYVEEWKALRNFIIELIEDEKYKGVKVRRIDNDLSFIIVVDYDEEDYQRVKDKDMKLIEFCSYFDMPHNFSVEISNGQ